MKMPSIPPDFRSEFIRLMQTAAKSGSDALAALAKRTVEADPVDEKGRYLHWEDFRFKPTEDGLSAVERWALVRRSRDARRAETLFRDKTGSPFFFVKTDFVERALHEIDSQTRGGVRFDGSSPTHGEAQSFLVTSLIEEPFSSSVFEGAIATRDQAKKIIRENRPPKTEGERMILNNYNAIEFIKGRKDEPLTPAVVCGLQKIITAGTLAEPAKAGAFRNEKDDIAVDDIETGEILHNPPPARELDDRVALLCKFANAESEEDGFIHPIIRAIIIHFMLAYDHPFVDGNGRTARALFYWSVLRSDYWLLEYVSISKQIKEAPIQYGKAFLETETDGGDLTYFIHNQLDMILKAIDALYLFIERKQAEVSALQKALSDRQMTAAFNHRQLALLNRAAHASGLTITIDLHRRTTGVSYLTARNDLEGLADAKFFTKRKRGATSVYVPVKSLNEKLTAAEAWRR